MMALQQNPPATLRLYGTIQEVDTLTRQLKVLVNGNVMDVVVPSDAEIILNEERVKLRLFQPGDHVHGAYWLMGPVAFARAVQVTSAP
jgi:hypothetical protein